MMEKRMARCQVHQRVNVYNSALLDGEEEAAGLMTFKEYCQIEHIAIEHESCRHCVRKDCVAIGR